MASLTAACGGGGDGGFVSPPPPPPPPPVTVSIAPGTATVNVGATTTFTVTISGGSPTPTLSTCTSSSTATATVSVSGNTCVATGVTAGPSTITATTSGGQTAQAQLTVAALPPAITAFTITPVTGTVPTGQTLTLTPSVSSAAGATVTVSYSTNTPAVATVSTAGVVTGVSPGTATITAVAQGSGASFSPASITQTVGITVTAAADPCAPAPVALPITRNGSVTATSCIISTGTQRRGDILRTNLATATAVELRITPTGFLPFIAALPASESEFVFFSGATAGEIQRTWHLPAGLTELRVGAFTPGQTGTYTLQAQSVSASVDNCVAVVVGGSVTSTQQLQASDCVFGGFVSDEFIVFSSQPCVITMNRGPSNGVVDPYLEVFAGSTLVAEDDDSGGNGNARLALPSCRTTAGEVLTVRATTFVAGDMGTYTFGVQFGAAAVAAVEAAASDARSVKARVSRPPMPGTARTWQERVGVERRAPVR